MHLVQILLPLTDNDGQLLPGSLHEQVKTELSQRFGGATAHLKAPADGMWCASRTQGVVHDEIVVIEIMTDTLEREFWRAYRLELEQRFDQECVIIRALATELL